MMMMMEQNMMFSQRGRWGSAFRGALELWIKLLQGYQSIHGHSRMEPGTKKGAGNLCEAHACRFSTLAGSQEMHKTL